MAIYRLDAPEITIREIRADDGERLRAAHGRLSAEAQYRRFLGPKPALSAADARYLVEIDGCGHFALVATLADDPDVIVGVARFVRLADDPTAAEFAIVVGDPHQGRGLGTEMMRELIHAARRRGVERFVASILAGNLPALRLVRRLASGAGEERRHGALVEIEFSLDATKASLGDRGPAMIAACLGSSRLGLVRESSGTASPRSMRHSARSRSRA
jgi:RimJ/RimL family protein N-acetyltransferase